MRQGVLSHEALPRLCITVRRKAACVQITAACTSGASSDASSTSGAITAVGISRAAGGGCCHVHHSCYVPEVGSPERSALGSGQVNKKPALRQTHDSQRLSQRGFLLHVLSNVIEVQPCGQPPCRSRGERGEGRGERGEARGERREVGEQERAERGGERGEERGERAQRGRRGTL
jgi:hypothetical protein